MVEIKNNVLQLLGNRSALTILHHLYTTAGGESGRRIAQLVAMSHPVVNATLAQLAAHGLVIVQSVGRAYAYTLNRKHLLVQHGLGPLFTTAHRWPTMIGAFYMRRLPVRPLSIILFGSLARGDAAPTSDMDLLFLYRREKNVSGHLDTITALSSIVYGMYGHSPSPVVMSAEQFRNAARKRTGLTAAALREGIVIAGATTTEALTK